MLKNGFDYTHGKAFDNGQECYLAQSIMRSMRPLLTLLLTVLSLSLTAQDSTNTAAASEPDANMTKEQKIAAAKAKMKAASDTTAQEPALTPFEEAWKSYVGGLELKERRKYDEAQAEFDKAIEIDPNFVEAYVGRGGIKFQKIEFPAALEDYNRAVEISENLVEMHEYKASIKDVLADYEGSKIEGSKAEKMKERMAEALYHRGHLKRFMEDKGGGCQDLRKALELGNLRAKNDWQDLCQ